MQKDPFVVLGVSENISQDDLYRAYKEKRALYEDKRFEPGEVGAEACAMLEEIETAYNDARDILRTRAYDEKIDFGAEKTTDEGSENLDEAEQAIKENRMDDAQRILDNCTSRSARWHYIQSAIFYRKNWHSDALKQLEFACNMEPSNTKYADAKRSLEKQMKAHTSEKDNSFYKESEKNGERVYSGPDSGYTAGRRGCSVCDCCSSLICADCCCECMGGDLISCC